MKVNRLILYANYIYRKNLGWGSCYENQIGVLKMNMMKLHTLKVWNAVTA